MECPIQSTSVQDRYMHWLVNDAENHVTRKQAVDALDSILDRAKAVWKQSYENLQLTYRICSRAGALIDRKFHVVVEKDFNTACFAYSTFNDRKLVLPDYYKITNVDSGLSISVPDLDSKFNPETQFLGYTRPQNVSVEEIARVLELKAGSDYPKYPDLAPFDCLLTNKYQELEEGFTFYEYCVGIPFEMEVFLFATCDESNFLTRWKAFLNEYNKIFENESLSKCEKMLAIKSLVNEHVNDIRRSIDASCKF